MLLCNESEIDMKRTNLLAPIALAALLFSASPLFAQISLGTAQNFGALAGSTLTNTGATTVNGNVGVSPGSAVTGFPPGVVVGGAIHSNDAVAMQAQTDLTTAYNNIASTPCTVDLTGQNLGGLVLTPGVYCFNTSAQLTGALTLDALGNANALFLFKIGSTLTTASASTVTVINNGGNSCNKVFWQVGSSATIGTGSTFVGDILALSSITFTTGSSSNGRALARNGAVTLDGNQVNTCGVSVCPIITVNPATLPNGAVGTPYNQTVTASGGTSPYTFALSSGTLPPGLSLNGATGAITGTPTTAGTSTITITARDANGCFGSRLYDINIASPGCPVILLAPITLPPAIALQPYSQQITASGGTAPYTFTVSGGALPAGLILSPSGLITGTTAQRGLFNFTIRATDLNGCQGSRTYSMLILALPAADGPTLSITGLATLMVLLAVAGLFVMKRLSI